MMTGQTQHLFTGRASTLAPLLLLVTALVGALMAGPPWTRWALAGVVAGYTLSGST